MENGKTVIRPVRTSWTFTSIILLCLCFSLSPAGRCATTKDLEDSIASLQGSVSSLQAEVTGLQSSVDRLLARLTLTNATQSALFVAGLSTGTAGTTVQVPLSFVPSLVPIAAVQSDIFLPAGYSVASVDPGPAAVAANKTVSFSSTTAIVFGLNQTPIGAGVLAVLNIKVPATAPHGLVPIGLQSPVASDPSGNSTPICVTSGVVKL